ncbi:expressed unknown protein [Seminavis robusta]|uniref:Helicase-associated domain-containing protein n=1 Tax=Seminavis robusta TaxID=568900 RepID=A0A9N8DHW1_9STRA|nr:expressed unknown protein [Seminavis robusta]|eukprot:Sro154_g070010.1 n/a (187) ;mRNA; f:41535-42095
MAESGAESGAEWSGSLNTHLLGGNGRSDSDRKMTKLDKNWMELYKELVEFYHQFGHCIIPDKPPYRHMYAWLFRQRKIKENLIEWRRDLLNKLGSDAMKEQATIHKRDDRNFQVKLKAYRYAEESQNGTTPVQSKELARWAHAIRRLDKDNKLDPERRQVYWRPSTFDSAEGGCQSESQSRMRPFG